MSPKRLAAVIPGRLYQSGCPASLQDVRGARITAILSVGHTEQPWIESWKDACQAEFRGPEQPRQPIHAHIPLFDASNCLDVRACDAAIVLGVRVLRDPTRRLLVHCDLGAFRSVHVSAGILASIIGVDGPTAFERVDIARGSKSPRRGLTIKGWDAHLQQLGGHV